MILKMLELNVEVDAEMLKDEEFIPVREIKEVERFPSNTWIYSNSQSHEIYLVVESDCRNKIKPIRYFNISSGKTQGYEENRKC